MYSSKEIDSINTIPIHSKKKTDNIPVPPKYRDIFCMHRGRKNPLIIGVCGRSTSGKTTVSSWLAKQFPEDVLWIQTDRFFNIRVEKKTPNTCWFECPPSVDWEKLLTAVKTLKNNEPARVPSRSWIKISNKLVYPTPVIIVEGYLIFTNKELLKLFDKKIYIEVSDLHLLYRRMIREGRFAKLIQMFYRRLLKEGEFANLEYVMQTVIPISKKFEKIQKKLADVVLNGNKAPKHLCYSMLKALSSEK